MIPTWMLLVLFYGLPGGALVAAYLCGLFDTEVQP